MTVSAQTPRSGPYSGNGSTTAFGYGFLVEAETEIVVTVADAAGAETIKTLTTDYTVSGVGNSAGGDVTFVTAPISTEEVVVTRTIAMTQATDLQNRKSVVPQVLEDAYDKLTRITQDHKEQLGRSLKVDLFGSTNLAALTVELGVVAGIASDVTIVANISADVTAVADISADVTIVAGISEDVVSFSDIYLGAKASDPTVDNRGNPLVAGALYTNTTDSQFRYYDGAGWDGPEHSSSSLGTGVGDGTTTAFAILNAASSLLYTTVFIDGVYQNKAGLSVSGSTLTFSEAPPLNAVIETISYTPIVVGYEFADLLVTGTLSVDTIAEETAGSGVTIDSVLLKDGNVDGRDVSSDGTKLDGVEASADVTDTLNVTEAGALMDSEVTNLAQVKAFDTADYATASQGSTADTAVQPNDSATLTALDVDTISEKTAANGVAIDGVTLKDGNVVLASGNGIDFSATSGTGTSELFDDYEEGTWTPDVQDASGNSASTSSILGLYTKVGDIVTAFIRVLDVNTSGLTGGDPIRVYGLPYTALGVVRYVGAAVINNWTGTTGLITQFNGGNTFVQFKTPDGGNAIVSEITSGSADIYAQVTYKV
jgi:hypothetical protein